MFTEKLKKGDTIKCKPVKIEKKKDKNIKPVNCRTPIPIPIHLRKPANVELKGYLEAGIIERRNHWTPWLCRGMFIPKKQDEETGEIKVRLVAEFSPVNETLESPNIPNEGSSAHLKEIDPNARCFATLDFRSGYYQIEIPEEDGDLFAFVLPQGKFRFTRNPQGTKPAGNIFNIVSNEELRDMESVKKNMDDMLLSKRSFKKLDPVIDKVLAICRKKNMKLNPKKFKIGASVEFGGTNVKYSPANKEYR